MTGSFVARDDDCIGAIPLCGQGVFVGCYGGDNLAAIGVDFFCDPVAFTQSVVYDGDFLIKNNLGVFFGPGEVQGQISGKKFIRKLFDPLNKVLLHRLIESI